MIENSDRGITRNKALAWTMLVGLLSGGVWVGSTLAELSGAISGLRDSQSTYRAATEDRIGRFDDRLRSVESGRAGDSAELAGLRRDLSDFRTDMKALAEKLDTLNARLLRGVAP